jgi:hypothetical protein
MAGLAGSDPGMTEGSSLKAIGRGTAVASTMIIAGTGIAIGTSAMIVAMTEIGATIGIAARKGTGGMPGPRSVDPAVSPDRN